MHAYTHIHSPARLHACTDACPHARTHAHTQRTQRMRTRHSVLSTGFVFVAPTFMLDWAVKMFTTVGSFVTTLGSLTNGAGGRAPACFFQLFSTSVSQPADWQTTEGVLGDRSERCRHRRGGLGDRSERHRRNVFDLDAVGQGTFRQVAGYPLPFRPVAIL